MSSLSSETAPAEKIQNETEEKKQVPAAEEGELEADDGTECEVNVRSEFKSCIDETISTVCRVASMKKKLQAENKQ